MRGAQILAGAILVTFLGPNASSAQQSPPPNPGVTEAPAVIVKIENAAFNPETITLRIGQQVKFENDDVVGHTVTASDGSFDSGYLAKGDRWQISFSVARTVLFSDIYHPAMHGQIVIVVN